MAEEIHANITESGLLSIKTSVENAIQNVLGNTDPNSTMAAAGAVGKLENTISMEIGNLTSMLTDVATSITNLRSSTAETARQSAASATATEEQTSPLGRSADTLDSILQFLQEKFKPTDPARLGLGTEDANIGVLATRQDELVNQDEATRPTTDDTTSPSATVVEEQASPLARSADTLDSILQFLQEKFKSKGLGTVDANVGMLKRKERSQEPQDEKGSKDPKEEKEGSVFVAGAIVAATMMAIKEKLNETWVGLTQRFLKPVAAFKLAFEPWSKSLRRANISVWKLTRKITNFTKKLAPRITKIFTSIADAGRKVGKVIRNIPGSITKAVKNFNLGKIFKPVTNTFKKIPGSFGKAITNSVKNFNLDKIFKPITNTFKNLPGGLGKAITNSVKNFKLGKIFKPVMSAIGKLTGFAGFGGLFSFMKPVLGVFKKLALPITLVLEAFEAFKMIFVGSFSKNAEALSESISERGVIGRALYGLTHVFQTIATFGYELVETFKAVMDVAAIFLDPVVDAFHSLTDTISNMFLGMYNAIARNSLGLIDEIPTEDAKRMDRRESLKRSLNREGVSSEERADRIADTIIDRGSKVGVELEDGEDYTSFKDRVLAAERAKKSQKEAKKAPEQPAPQELIPVPTKNQDGFNPRGVEQQNIQQNSIQNNTTFEVQMPTAASVLNQ